MAGSLTTTNDQTIWPSAICHLLDPHIQKIRFFFKEARKDWIRSTFQPAFNLATRTFCSVKQALAADSWWKGKCSSGPGWYEDSLGDICIVSTSSLSLFLLLVLSFIVGYLQYLIRGRLTWKCSCNINNKCKQSLFKQSRQTVQQYDIMMVTVNKYCDIEEDDDDNDNNDGDDDCYSVEVQRSQPQSSSQPPTV